MKVNPAKAEHIPHEDYDNLWADSNFINENFVAEVKKDGSRYLLYIDELGKSKLLSRRISDVTGEYVDKTLHCPHLTRVLVPKELYGTIIDGELVHPNTEKSDATTSIMGCTPERAVQKQNEEGWLEYHVYDIPKFGNNDLRQIPLKKRKEFLKKVVNILFSNKVPVVMVQSVPASEAKKLYEAVTNRGGEGIMLKSLNASYGSGWFKVKKVKTWDVIITGFEKPQQFSKKSNGEVSETSYWKEKLIGAIKFGLYKNGQIIELGTCSGMSESMRRDFSQNKESYIGKVIEIKAQERTKKGAFRSPRFIRIREDKDASQCVDL
jgi:ATP-dependent DNA ligase